MNYRRIAALPLAAATLFLLPAISRAQSGTIASEAPGVVVLSNKLDAKKLGANGTVEVRLTKSVKLSNGVEIPKGSTLVGTVANDDMQVQGGEKLALRFNEARPKKGQPIPIKATILSVSTNFMPVENDPSDIEAVINTPDTLAGEPDRIDQAGVTGGVDLHSNATSANSGVFVTSKDDIKLPNGTKMLLAIAPGTK